MIRPTSRSSAERATRPGITKVKQMAYANAELRKWNQRPFESALSKDAANARFGVVGGKLATRTAVMCRWCGSVFVASADRLRKSGKSGQLYCDRECAGKHRSHLYKGNDEIHDVICEKAKKLRKYESTNISIWKCVDCGKVFCTKLLRRADRCSLCKANWEKFYKRRRSWKKVRGLVNPKEVTCEWCETLFTKLVRVDGVSSYCSTSCRLKSERRKRRHTRRERELLPAGAYRGRVLLKQVFEDGGGLCCSCGVAVVMSKTYKPNQATVDHKIPLSRGGLHVEENVQLMCQACNSSKSDSLEACQQLLLPV